MKKQSSKVAHNQPPTFFSVLARLPKWPKTEILYPQNPLNAGLGIQTGDRQLIHSVGPFASAKSSLMPIGAEMEQDALVIQKPLLLL